MRESDLEHFKGCLIIPIINDGQVLGLYGCRMGEASQYRKGTPMHLYLPGPHHGVFNRDAMIKKSEVILCEALIDALTLWHCGYTNVTSSYGVHGFTAGHVAAFKSESVGRVIIAYDTDDAGDRAALDLADKLQGMNIGSYRARLPKGMDINGYALKVQPASKSLGLVFSHAQWLGDDDAPELRSVSNERAITDALAEGVDLPPMCGRNRILNFLSLIRMLSIFQKQIMESEQWSVRVVT